MDNADEFCMPKQDLDSFMNILNDSFSDFLNLFFNKGQVT